MLRYRYMDDIFDSVFTAFQPVARQGFGTLNSGVRSKINDDRLVISTDLPGTSKDSVDITFEPITRNIKINSKRYDTDVTSTVYYALPKGWDYDSACAELADGVLSITLDKCAEDKPKKLLIK